MGQEFYCASITLYLQNSNNNLSHISRGNGAYTEIQIREIKVKEGYKREKEGEENYKRTVSFKHRILPRNFEILLPANPYPVPVSSGSSRKGMQIKSTFIEGFSRNEPRNLKLFLFQNKVVFIYRNENLKRFLNIHFKCVDKPAWYWKHHKAHNDIAHLKENCGYTRLL